MAEQKKVHDVPINGFNFNRTIAKKFTKFPDFYNKYKEVAYQDVDEDTRKQFLQDAFDIIHPAKAETKPAPNA